MNGAMVVQREAKTRKIYFFPISISDSFDDRDIVSPPFQRDTRTFRHLCESAFLFHRKKWAMNCFSRQRRVFSGASGAHPRSMPNDRKRRCALVSGVGPTLPTEVVAEELADPKHVQP